MRKPLHATNQPYWKRNTHFKCVLKIVHIKFWHHLSMIHCFHQESDTQSRYLWCQRFINTTNFLPFASLTLLPGLLPHGDGPGIKWGQTGSLGNFLLFETFYLLLRNLPSPFSILVITRGKIHYLLTVGKMHLKFFFPPKWLAQWVSPLLGWVEDYGSVFKMGMTNLRNTNFFFFLREAKPSMAQGLLQVLHSGITPVSAWRVGVFGC